MMIMIKLLKKGIHPSLIEASFFRINKLASFSIQLASSSWPAVANEPPVALVAAVLVQCLAAADAAPDSAALPS